MIKYMSEKYYREINTNKDIIKFKYTIRFYFIKIK